MKSLLITGYVFLKSMCVLLWFAVFVGFPGLYNYLLWNKFTSDIGTDSESRWNWGADAEELIKFYFEICCLIFSLFLIFFLSK